MPSATTPAANPSLQRSLYWHLLSLLASQLLLAGLGCRTPPEEPPPRDDPDAAGLDSGPPDAGPGADAGPDAGPLDVDGGPDAGPFDGDGGVDGGPTWQALPIRTRAQLTAQISGGEGHQQITDLSFAPSNGRVAYFVTDASQVWKSTDEGATWRRKSNGFRSGGGNVLAVSPYDEDLVFVGGCSMGFGVTDPASVMGIWRSVDGAESWSLVLPVFYDRSSIGSQNIAFAGRQIVYVGTKQNGLYKSTDGGSIWNRVDIAALNGHRIIDVTVHPTDSSVLFVSDVTANKLYRVTGDSTVTVVGAGLPDAPRRVIPTQDGAGGPDRLLFYAAAGRNVWRSTDSGRTFAAISPTVSPFVSNMAVSPVDSNDVYFKAYENTSHFYTRNGRATNPTWLVPQSLDERNVDGWVGGSLFGETPLGASFYYTAPFAPHPTNRDIILHSGDGAIIKKSTNGGVDWRFSASGATGMLVTSNYGFGFDMHDSKRFALFFMDAGAYITEDNGSTFRSLNIGGPRGWAPGSTLLGAISPFRPNTVLTAMGGWNLLNLYITRNADAATPSWTIIPGAAADYSMASLMFHPTNPNVAYVGNRKFYDLEQSNALKSVIYNVGAMYPGNGDIIYSLRPGSTPGSSRLYKSLDGGENWIHPYPDIPFHSSNSGLFAVSPDNPDKIYIPFRFSGVVILTTAGYSLKNELHGLSLSDLPHNTVNTYRLTIDPRHANVIYAQYDLVYIGQDRGLFRSIDGGEHWENINYNLGDHIPVSGIRVHPLTGFIYAGSGFGTNRLAPPY